MCFRLLRWIFMSLVWLVCRNLMGSYEFVLWWCGHWCASITEALLTREYAGAGLQSDIGRSGDVFCTETRDVTRATFAFCVRVTKGVYSLIPHNHVSYAVSSPVRQYASSISYATASHTKWMVTRPLWWDVRFIVTLWTPFSSFIHSFNQISWVWFMGDVFLSLP